ncbi:hypothetical protein Dimus_030399 [Dionaea muscipula]
MEESASMEEDSHPDLRISPVALSSRLKNCPDLIPSDLDLSLVAVDLVEASPFELVSVGDDGGDGGFGLGSPVVHSVFPDLDGVAMAMAGVRGAALGGNGVVSDSCSTVCSSLPSLLVKEPEVMRAALTVVDGGRGEMERADGLVVASDVFPEAVSRVSLFLPVSGSTPSPVMCRLDDGVRISPWVGGGAVRPQPTDGLRQHPSHRWLPMQLGGWLFLLDLTPTEGVVGWSCPWGWVTVGLRRPEAPLVEADWKVLSAETVGGLPSQIVAAGALASSYAGGGSSGGVVLTGVQQLSSNVQIASAVTKENFGQPGGSLAVSGQRTFAMRVAAQAQAPPVVAPQRVGTGRTPDRSSPRMDDQGWQQSQSRRGRPSVGSGRGQQVEEMGRVSSGTSVSAHISRVGPVAPTRGGTSRFALLSVLDESDPIDGGNDKDSKADLDDLGTDLVTATQQAAITCVEEVL